MDESEMGYSIHEDVFERAEMARMLESLAQADIARTKARARHVLSVPVVRDLASDPRLIDMAGRFLGSDPVAFRATLFDKARARTTERHAFQAAPHR
jgi:hypothetical protein